MGIAFAAAVAGGLAAHQARVHAVLQVAGEDAVLDQHGALRRIAFVVHVQAAAAVGQGAVVEHGHALGGHALADAVGEGAAALAVEVAFQAVADGLVQQHAGPAGAQHHVHLAGGGGAGLQVGQGGADGFVHILGEQGIVEIVQAQAATAAGRADLAARLSVLLLFGDHRQTHAHQGTHVGRQRAVGAGHQHHVVLGSQPRHHLLDARIPGAGHFLDALEQGHLGGAVQRGNGVEGRIQLAAARHFFGLGLDAGLDAALLAGGADGAHGTHGVHQRGERDVVRVGKRGFLARNGAHAHALVDAEAAGLDDAFLQAPAFAAGGLEIQVGVIDLARVHGGQRLVQMVARQAEGFEQQRFGNGQALARAFDRGRGHCRSGKRGTHVHARIVGAGSKTAIARVRCGAMAAGGISAGIRRWSGRSPSRRARWS